MYVLQAGSWWFSQTAPASVTPNRSLSDSLGLQDRLSQTRAVSGWGLSYHESSSRDTALEEREGNDGDTHDGLENQAGEDGVLVDQWRSSNEFFIVPVLDRQVPKRFSVAHPICSRAYGNSSGQKRYRDGGAALKMNKKVKGLVRQFYANLFS